MKKMDEENEWDENRPQMSQRGMGGSEIGRMDRD
jgi:hypothetical protein